MKLDTKIKYFIAGFTIPVVIVPLIDYVMNILGALQEVTVLRISKTAAKLQKECQEIIGTDEDQEEVHTCAIGFQPPEDYVYEGDDLEDD